MANNTYSQIVTELNNGIDIDVDPSNQPKGSRRFTLNTVERSINGHINLSNEPRNIVCETFPDGYVSIGDRYIGNNETLVILCNEELNRQDIGIIDKNDKYISYVKTGLLNLSIKYQCDIRFRVRRGNERVVYWTDGNNNARSLNLDRLSDFYNVQFKQYLSTGGDPDTYTLEKWDASSFELIKTTSTIPTFDNISVLEYGSIPPGSYNFTIQLVDEDLNSTEWITTSNTVNIYNDSTDSVYATIRGSRNINTASQSFPRASKSIRLTIGNLDTSFPYYRVGIIRASAGTGVPDKVLVSDLQATTNSVFQYSGNENSLQETPIGDILIDKEVIYAPKHLEQIDNILTLYNTKGKGINWCEFQQYASKIKANLCTKQVILNSAFSDANVKNAKSTFNFRGYMPGEVYSFAIVWIFKDGFISPAFHIPGKNSTDNNSDMLYHQLDSKYLDIHNCSTGNYWGVDNLGQTLVGKNVRHHRFPFRKDVGKPVVTRTSSTTNINKYKLSLVFSLNPAHTPSPEYPKDGDDNPIPISYTINYQINGAANTASFNGTLVDTDVSTGASIVIYDDTVALDDITTGVKYELDPDSQLATYQDGVNDVFIITATYTPYVASTVENTDISEIFGIEFGNIEKPHPDVIGFYIVRNKREDEDRIVIDNALFGTMTESSNYKTFGLVMPKQYYDVDNCGTENSSGKTVTFSNDSMWFFSPEYEYFQKRLNFENVVVEGRYNETSYNMPTISNVTGSTCNKHHSKGVYINDVQAGTSFNPDVNKKKDKDDDGFDLIIGYRNTNVTFTPNTSNITMPDLDRTIYLTAAAHQNYNGKTYYNVSVDNKIGMYIASETFSSELLRNTAANTNRLVYGSMTRTNTTSYSNFTNRPYYKEFNNHINYETNNVINGVQVFNGDAQISATTINSTVFYDMVVADRAKKSGLWKIIAGAVLVIAGIVLTIYGGPLGIAIGAEGVALLAGLALSYGVSLVMSGIKFEQFKSMVEVDYEKGLKDTITDGGVYETIREEVETEDDTIRWFGDLLSTVYIETSVPMGLRSGLTSGIPDFVDAPTTFNEPAYRSYLTEKLTTIDREQGSGRLYRGFASAEIYDMNLDYMRFNEQKIYSHLPIEYNCCSDSNEEFPRRAWYSQQSFQEEKVDNYRSFLPNNYVDIEGEHGEITGVYRMGGNLFIQTREATWQLLQNKQERVTNEIVSFIGTGNLFDILPRKVVDDDLGSLGTMHKWANIKTRVGHFSISETEGKIFLHADKIEDISARGIGSFCKEDIKPFLSTQMYAEFGITLKNINNPVNPNGVGYHATYDSKYDRVIFTKRDYLLLPDRVDSLVIVANKPISDEDTDFVFNTSDELFYQGTQVIHYNNPSYFEDKSFTISYSLVTKRWVSWHSYIPNYYIHAKNSMYSIIAGNNNLYKHNIETGYQIFYDTYFPHIIEGVIRVEDITERTFEDIQIQTRAMSYSSATKQFVDKRFVTFNKITIYDNERCSGELNMQVKQENPNKQKWYSQQTTRIVGSIIIDRREVGWNINNFRDYVVDYNTPFFTTDWETIKTQYPIDKVVTPDVIDFRKDWRTLESFKGKYIVFRLKLDNFDNINLITNYLISTVQISD